MSSSNRCMQLKFLLDCRDLQVNRPHDEETAPESPGVYSFRHQYCIEYVSCGLVVINFQCEAFHYGKNVKERHLLCCTSVLQTVSCAIVHYHDFTFLVQFWFLRGWSFLPRVFPGEFLGGIPFWGFLCRFLVWLTIFSIHVLPCKWGS